MSYETIRQCTAVWVPLPQGMHSSVTIRVRGESDTPEYKINGMVGTMLERLNRSTE